MNSFRDIRELVLLSYCENIISDEEFVVLYNYYESKNPNFNYEKYEPFCLESYNSEECKEEFCVEKVDIPRLVEALQLPETLVCQQRSICSGTEALCLLLKRMAYPCRYSDMIPHFPRPVSVLSLITNNTLDFLYETHGHLVTEWNQILLNPPALQSYADSITSKGSPLSNCFGFIDGTVRPISRPGHAQRVVYNGHKRVHALKFQSVALPNGLVGNIFGPVGKYLFVMMFCYFSTSL